MPTRVKNKARKKTTKVVSDEKKAETTRPVGRPTKYDPKYCEVVIEEMSKGYSKEACAGIIGVSKNTFYEWVKAHPEFQDAVSIGEAKSQVFWEGKGIKHLTHTKNGEQLNTGVYNLHMGNRFGWGQKKDHTHDIGEEAKKTLAFDFSEAPKNRVK